MRGICPVKRDAGHKPGEKEERHMNDDSNNYKKLKHRRALYAWDKMSREQRAAKLAQYEGLTLEETARKMHMTRYELLQRLAKDGIKRKRAVRKTIVPSGLDLDEVYARHQNGASMASIARDTGVNYQKLLRLMRAKGYKAKNYKPETHYDEATIAGMYDEYRQGARVADLANRYGLADTSIYRYFRNAGLECGHRLSSNYKRYDEKLARKMYEEYSRGAKAAAIARKYHIGYQDVYRYFRLAGLPCKRALNAPERPSNRY